MRPKSRVCCQIDAAMDLLTTQRVNSAAQVRRAIWTIGLLLIFASGGAPARAEPTDLASLRQRLDALVLKGDHEAALKVAQAVVTRVTVLHGPDHIETARCLFETANLHAEVGSYLEAERLYSRALRIREVELGPVDSAVADILVASAAALHADARDDEAAPLLRRAIKIREDNLGTSHPDTGEAVNQLGVCLFAKEAYQEAGAAFEQCLLIFEKTFGPAHPNTAQALTNLASVYRERGSYEKAKMLINRAFAIRRQAFGDDHEDTVDSIYDMGLIWFLEGSYESAEQGFTVVLRFRRRNFGDSDPQVAHIATMLIASYRAQDKEAEATALEREFDSLEGNASPLPNDAGTEINDE